MAKIKKGDTVVVISGSDTKKSGKVIAVFPDKGRVLVEGVNMQKKHRKARKMNEQSGIRNQEGPINVSNVMLLCGTCKEATRPLMKIQADGRKVRTCRKCGSELDK